MPVETFFSQLSPSTRALQQALEASGLQSRGNQPTDADLLLFEATEPAGASLNPQAVVNRLNHLRTGGRLLFTFSEFPGKAPLWLSEALPSTGWTSQQRPSSFAPQSPTPVLAADPAFFSGANLAGLAAPLGVDIRPVSAVERGQSRYERYALVHPVTGIHVAANSDLWSRPLLNREWTVRACYDDLARSPLLVTGRYGAGRVAMLATSVSALGESAAAQAFWRGVVGWLAQQDHPASAAASAHPTLAMSFPSPGSVRLTLANPSQAALPVQLVTRILDRDGAMLADGAGEFVKPLTLSPGKPTILDLPLPAPDIPGIEALESETSFLVRVGLLSADGSTLLAEDRSLSQPLPVSLHIATENIYTASSTFPGPDANALIGFQGRMGLPVGAYAFTPGQTVKASVTLGLQLENLTPRAVVHDQTQPGNASVMALNDRAAAIYQSPRSHIEAYGMWTGKAGVENALQFVFPEKVRIAAVTLTASHGGFLAGQSHNPGSAILELDGRQIAAVTDLDAALDSGSGQARIALPTAVTGSGLTLRLPWVAQREGQPRLEPWLGEVEIEGWPDSQLSTTALSGELAVSLVDSLTGQRKPVLSKPVSLTACSPVSEELSVALPASAGPGIYRLEAAFHPSATGAAVTALAPLLAVAPRQTLKNIQDITGSQVLGAGMIVTSGFIQFVSLGTGTAEPVQGWSHPDDLIWAYSRQLKEIGPKAHTAANRLYATESNFQHYSIPWREFGNGEMFFETCMPGLLQSLKKQGRWSAAPLVRLNFSDRWMLGPNLNSCNSWQEYVGFDSYLRASSGNGGAGRGLDGRTHAEVETSIHANYEDQWQAWQLTRYVHSVRAIREAFRAEGKDVVLYGQGWPIVAGDPGRELAKTLRGMNDDVTWGMQENSPNLTTGRTLSSLAFNPVWQVCSLLAWGFVSPVFNNWQWANPVGTTEPQRRLFYNYLWRGMVWDNGAFGSAATYGYNTNVGMPYTLTAEECRQWWRVQQRGSLLQPESPLGAGLVISTQKYTDPRATRWNGSDPTALPEIPPMMAAFRSLAEAGVSLPFATNASTLKDWKPTPGASLIVMNLEDFSPAEAESLSRLASQGVRIAAFAQRAKLTAAASALASRSGFLLIESAATGLTHPQTVALSARIIAALEVPLSFSEGFSGYGFCCQDLHLVVIEDWREQARNATVRLRKSAEARHAFAANLNDHSTLAVKDGGAFWEITAPVRSGDAALLAIRES